VKGDEALHQAVNLSVNAEAPMRRGVLEISASNVTLDAISSRIHPEATAGLHRIDISDTGTGCSPYPAKIFDPFYDERVRQGTLGHRRWNLLRSHGF